MGDTKNIFRFISAIIISVILTGCSTLDIKKEVAWKNEIMKTDEEFSKMSQQVGMKKSFIEYMDDDGVLLRPNHLPIVGANAIEYLSAENDSTYTLTWKPSTASVSASGDLGYSYGTYNLQLKDTLVQGTYLSIWKKQKKDGKWKFVLDTGNEGIDEVSK